VQDIPPSIVKAIAEIQSSVASVKRDGRNAHGGYDFASTDAVYAALSNKMGQAGLMMVTLEDEPEIKVLDATDKQGKAIKQKWARFSYQFVLATDDGTWTDAACRRSIFVQILGPQTHMAAQSYCEKAFLRSLFKLPTGDLDLDALPTDETPRQVSKTSSSKAKKDALWEKFVNEVDNAHELSVLHEIEGRYTSKMPNASWAEQMHEALERRRSELLRDFQ